MVNSVTRSDRFMHSSVLGTPLYSMCLYECTRVCVCVCVCVCVSCVQLLLGLVAMIRFISATRFK